MSLDAPIATNAMERQIPLGFGVSNASLPTSVPAEATPDFFNLKYSLLGLVLAAFVFRLSWAYLRNEKNLPQLAPGALPVVGHGLLFLSQPEKLAAIISNSKSGNVIRFKIPFGDIFLAAGGAQLVSVFMNPKIYDFTAMKKLVQRDLFGLPTAVIRLAQKDDSGFSTKPLPGSYVSPHGRFNYLERKASEEVYRAGSFAAFMEHFEESLGHWMNNCGIPETGEWVEYPDLYRFIRTMVTKTATDAFFGPELLRNHPRLEQDFWEYDSNVPFFAKRIPRWMYPGPYKIRDRCYSALESWRANAFKNCEKEDSKIPEWSSHAGLRINTIRDNMFNRFKEWTQNARANSDFSLMFGLNANSVNAGFWYFLETWQDKELFAEAVAEVRKCTIVEDGKKRFDGKMLMESPLLQSLFAETLRIYVTILYLRRTLRDAELDGKTIPKGNTVMMCNWSQQMNEDIWNPEGSPDIPSVTEFWGKRFLEYPEPSTENPDPAPRFKVEDISGGKWFPFSMGEHLCPGRNVAKREILLVFATLATYFEVEFTGSKISKPEPDMGRFGYGTMPPKGMTPCRIRRKAEDSI